jgi:G3E family GTPase
MEEEWREEEEDEEDEEEEEEEEEEEKKRGKRKKKARRRCRAAAAAAAAEEQEEQESAQILRLLHLIASDGLDALLVDHQLQELEAENPRTPKEASSSLLCKTIAVAPPQRMKQNPQVYLPRSSCFSAPQPIARPRDKANPA